jgi:hypothetical protein
MQPPIVQLVPHLPPPAEGVGGFAAALGGALARRCGIAGRFLVGDPRWAGDGAGGAEARPIAARTPEALVARLDEMEARAVLLHYANYGYQRRGCPAWLVGGLERWLAGGGRRLVTVFHEVFAVGPPWRSSFWLSPLQRRLASALARSSAGLVTSLDRYAGLLRPWAPGGRIVVLPVFSSVGEPETVPPLAARRRRLVVFGGAGVRGRAWGEGLPALAGACERLGIEEVVDVGPAAAWPPPARVAGAPVSAAGTLPAPAVGALLAESFAGFLAYPPPFLAKSTIFAAYCAHGALPVCAWPKGGGGDPGDSRDPADPGGGDGGPHPGRHYWRLPARDLSTRDPARRASGPADPQAIADAARGWYGGHALARHAATYAELLS